MPDRQKIIDQLTAADYAGALRAIEANISAKQREMLLAHYQAPGRRVTATELARTVGWASFEPANVQYGTLARKIGEMLGIRLAGTARLLVLVQFDKPGPEWEWTMRPQLAEALEQLGWCRPMAGLAEVEISGTQAGEVGPEPFRVTLFARAVALEFGEALSREAALRKAIDQARGTARRVLIDLYRQLVLGNYTRLDGESGNTARGALDRLYPEQGTLLGFDLKSGAYNTAGLIVYNLLQHPEPDVTDYRILTTILKRMLHAGVLEPPHLGGRLERLLPFVFPEEAPAVPLVEGAVRRVRVNAYERSAEARQKCIDHYGAYCAVCGFDFGKFYGPSMDGLIHVHHLRPLAEIGAAYEVDPIQDLVPVCPNCHAVIHRHPQALTIEAVRALIGR